MFELGLEQAKATLFKNVLEALSDLFSKAHFDFSGTGCELQALDTSHVALVALVLRPNAFNRYHCDSNVSMGLNLADIANAFRCSNNDDIITIKLEKLVETVSFTFKSPQEDEMSFFAFDFLGLNGVPFEILEPRESDYVAIVRMPSTKFMRVCNKLSIFGNSGDRDTAGVIISLDKERVHFFTRGKAGTSTIYCYRTKNVDKTKEPTLIEMKEEEVSLTVDLRYMISLCKVSALSDQVTICLSSKQPTMFEYKIAEMGYIRYYVASKIEDEIQSEGYERQRIAKEDKVQNEGDEMQSEGYETQRIAKEDKVQNEADEMQN